MPRLGLSLSGNGKSGSGIAGIELYSDTLQTAVSFNDRQWFCSDNSNSVLYGAQTSSGSGVETTSGHLLVHFDCRKEQYPTYSNSATYGTGKIISAAGVDAGSFSNGTFSIIQGGGSGGVITVLDGVISVTSAGTGYIDGESIKAGGSRYNLVTGDIVYGGTYGHALYRRTASASGAPIFSSALGAPDTNLWTRIKPALRTIQAGQYLNVSFKLEVINPTTFFDNSNAIRIGILGSSGSVANLVNTDTIGQSAIFSPYTGYLIGIGKNHRIYKRIPDSLNSTSLVSSMAAYTQLTNNSMTFNAGGANPVLSVDIKIGRTGANTIIRSVVSGYQANGHVTSGILSTFSDTADTLSFDTLAVQASSLNMSSFRVSNPYVALYSGSL
jgi:hypothetical protein